MDELLTAELEGKAVEVATLLNAIADDDARERAQEVFERRLNDELYHGSEVRAADVEHPSIALGSRVRRGSDGSEGVVRGFHRERVWSFRDRCTTVFALVDTEYGTEASWPLSDLTVVESAVEGGVR